MDQIDTMDDLKQGIYLRAYGQTDPVIAYKREGFAMFDGMINAIREETVRRLFLFRLRTQEDVEGILAGLKDGTIDAIATDHAPHSAEEKAKPLTEAPSGMVGLETALAITLTELYHSGRMELADILRKMTFNPSCILGINKGRVAIGGSADLTLFDPDEEWVIDPQQFASKGRNTPFAGRRVKGKVKYTIVNGNMIYQEV